MMSTDGGLSTRRRCYCHLAGGRVERAQRKKQQQQQEQQGRQERQEEEQQFVCINWLNPHWRIAGMDATLPDHGRLIAPFDDWMNGSGGCGDSSD